LKIPGPPNKALKIRCGPTNSPAPMLRSISVSARASPPMSRTLVTPPRTAWRRMRSASVRASAKRPTWTWVSTRPGITQAPCNPIRVQRASASGVGT
jgi:hypothetical protein